MEEVRKAIEEIQAEVEEEKRGVCFDEKQYEAGVLWGIDITLEVIEDYLARLTNK